MLRLGKRAHLGLFKRPEQHAYCLEAPCAVALEELAGKRDLGNDGVLFHVRDVEPVQTLPQALLGACVGEGLTNGVTQLSIGEHLIE